MIEEDFQAWSEYPHYRWLFNKLEVAQRLEYDSGPSGVPITEAKYYIIRPTYNLFGMGIGAEKKYLDPELHNEEIINCKHIVPGYFWCEYFDGPHYSIDFKRENGEWQPFSATEGTHVTEDNLVKFEKWEVIEPPIVLPKLLQEIDVEYMNVESKGDKIFEVHLRSGNDMAWHTPIGTIFYPVWSSSDYSALSDLEFVGNYHDDITKYEANGLLKDVRLGYYIDK